MSRPPVIFSKRFWRIVQLIVRERFESSDRLGNASAPDTRSERRAVLPG